MMRLPTRAAVITLLVACATPAAMLGAQTRLPDASFSGPSFSGPSFSGPSFGGTTFSNSTYDDASLGSPVFRSALSSSAAVSSASVVSMSEARPYERASDDAQMLALSSLYFVPRTTRGVEGGASFVAPRSQTPDIFDDTPVARLGDTTRDGAPIVRQLPNYQVMPFVASLAASAIERAPVAAASEPSASPALLAPSLLFDQPTLEQLASVDGGLPVPLINTPISTSTTVANGVTPVSGVAVLETVPAGASTPVLTPIVPGFGVPAVTATPEPATIVLVATGLAGVMGLARRRARQARRHARRVKTLTDG